MNVGYIAVETFYPDEKYKEWCKLFHVKEIVSFDCALCPRVLDLDEIDIDVDLQKNGFYSDMHKDLDFLISKIEDKKDIQILAVIREPDNDCFDLDVRDNFTFYGYDLIEDFTRISALTNCGGFDKAFSSKDISEYGLIREFARAKQIQYQLAKEYPEESHADCVLWAIWRMGNF